MRVRATNIGAWCLVLALALSACLVAAASHSTGAYFSDSCSGVMTGTYASPEPPEPTVPYRLEAGKSRVLHQGCTDDRPACGPTIAQFDEAGAMSLDFGETRSGGGDSRPDVFRLVSLVDDARTATFHVAGPMADFVDEVHLGNGKSCVLEGGESERVCFKIRVPKCVAPGSYPGTLTIHVQGWPDDALVPMTIDVREEKPKTECGSVEVVELSDVPSAPPSVEATATTSPAQGGTAPIQEAPPAPSDSPTSSVPATAPVGPAPIPESAPVLEPVPVLEEPETPAAPATSTPTPTETATAGEIDG